jgi:hypothetical protein
MPDAEDVWVRARSRLLDGEPLDGFVYALWAAVLVALVRFL